MLTTFEVNTYYVRSKHLLRSKQTLTTFEVSMYIGRFTCLLRLMWHDLGLVLCSHHFHTCIAFLFYNGRSPPLFVPHLLNPKVEYVILSALCTFVYILLIFRWLCGVGKPGSCIHYLHVTLLTALSTLSCTCSMQCICSV